MWYLARLCRRDRRGRQPRATNIDMVHQQHDIFHFISFSTKPSFVIFWQIWISQYTEMHDDLHTARKRSVSAPIDINTNWYCSSLSSVFSLYETVINTVYTRRRPTFYMWWHMKSKKTKKKLHFDVIVYLIIVMTAEWPRPPSLRSLAPVLLVSRMRLTHWWMMIVFIIRNDMFIRCVFCRIKCTTGIYHSCYVTQRHTANVLRSSGPRMYRDGKFEMSLDLTPACALVVPPLNRSIGAHCDRGWYE